MNIFFKIFTKLFPSGDAFLLSVEKNLTKFIQSLSALPQDFRNYINLIYLDLFPNTTRALELWCETFGLSSCQNEDDIRMDLDTIWKAQGGQGADYIQSILNNAGFDVQVHENNPPVDPDLFLNSIPVMVAQGVNAYAGRSDAYAGRTGGELLVNSAVLINIPLYNSVAGKIYMMCNNPLARAGQFDKFITKDKAYSVTDDPDLWGAYFFVGGDAARDPITHELTSITNADVNSQRESEFKKLILKYKPTQTHVGLLINYR